MSHFTVGIITDDLNKVPDLLEPYSEELKVEPYISRTKADMIKEAKERKQRYSEGAKEHSITAWQQAYLDAFTDEELYTLEGRQYFDGKC